MQLWRRAALNTRCLEIDRQLRGRPRPVVRPHRRQLRSLTAVLVARAAAPWRSPARRTRSRAGTGRPSRDVQGSRRKQPLVVAIEPKRTSPALDADNSELHHPASAVEAEGRLTRSSMTSLGINLTHPNGRCAMVPSRFAVAFVVTLGVCLAVLPVLAQPVARVARIGVLGNSDERGSRTAIKRRSGKPPKAAARRRDRA